MTEVSAGHPQDIRSGAESENVIENNGLGAEEAGAADDADALRTQGPLRKPPLSLEGRRPE
jgi:hypothetical protein